MKIIYDKHQDEEKLEQLIRETYGDGRSVDYIELTECEINNIGVEKFIKRCPCGTNYLAYQQYQIKVVKNHIYNTDNKIEKAIERLILLSNRI